MRNILIFVILVIALYSCVPESGTQYSKEDWVMGKLGENAKYPASVPGCVHLDLLDNGLIEDPFYGENEKDLLWVGETSWVYSKIFTFDPNTLEKDNIDLVFEGLDTYADVFLNDSLILKANNMFRAWELDVKGVLKPGENLLSVVFSPPGEINEDKAAEVPYKLPDNRAYTRKSPYHFGWDWGPEFITCGIWKPVYFRAWDDFRIKRMYISHESLDQDPLPVSVHLSIYSDNYQEVKISIFDDERKMEISQKDVVLKAGENNIEIATELDHPEKWWPAGLGSQKLYTFNARVIGENKFEQIKQVFGLREIELVRENDEYGESFYFKVNGLPVFMKGANYIPQDNFLTRVDTSRYEQLIQNVLNANMNMLRVWGGGFYENDIFYDLCDEYGILVWQDFMFACNMYPGDSAFLDNVKKEAIDNVTRLSNHPCIALWCGNNEIDEGWHNWGWQTSLGYSDEDSAKVWNDYLKLFHDLLPEVVEEYDPGTIYHLSSPMTGWGREEAYTKGDVHYWGVWWGEEPFEMYREKIGRFVSEYGFQGMPPMETIKSFAATADGSLDFARDDSFSNRALAIHQKHPRGKELIEKYMARDYIVPVNFEDYVYISQVVQAEGMAEAFLSHRISPKCMGTLYWQLNDCWPVTSWSGLDYYGRWKALHYHVKRAYMPLLIHLEEMNGQLSVMAVNDMPGEIDAVIQIVQMDFKGVLQSEPLLMEIILPSLNRTELYSMPIHMVDPSSSVVIADLLIGGELVSRSFYYGLPTKDLALPDPGTSWKVNGNIITITTKNHARQVFLEIPGAEGHFSDNFFDMAPGETLEIRFLGDASAEEIAQKLKIKTIYDTYN